jgi:argininosuccinate lyase
VLAENFQDATDLWLAPLVAIHYAHLVMLHDRGIIDRDTARGLAGALDGLDLTALARTPYDPIDEDLFFRVDRLLVAACGPDVAGRLHTARSRNDIDMTMYRMRLRADVLRLAGLALGLRGTLVTSAARHVRTVLAAHTHTQPAQPTTLAHYLLAVVEQLERDTARLLAAYRSINRCPLGACAITGTGFAIDRDQTSRLLGFAGPTGNTYGSIAAVDHLLEGAAAAATALVGLGRFVQDLLFWSTAEVGYLRLADGLVQVSSIMPQKRNPVALEHARALASRALAELSAIPHAVHNTPFGDVVDTEDDLQPLVASAFAVACRAIELVDVALQGAEVDTSLMRNRAGASWITATELADALAREHGVPFMTAHAITTTLVERMPVPEPARLAAELWEVSRALGHPVTVAPEALARILSPEHFVAVRATAGGPAAGQVEAALVRARESIAADTRLITEARESQARADADRGRAVETLRKPTS